MSSRDRFPPSALGAAMLGPPRRQRIQTSSSAEWKSLAEYWHQRAVATGHAPQPTSRQTPTTKQPEAIAAARKAGFEAEMRRLARELRTTGEPRTPLTLQAAARAADPAAIWDGALSRVHAQWHPAPAEPATDEPSPLIAPAPASDFKHALAQVDAGEMWRVALEAARGRSIR